MKKFVFVGVAVAAVSGFGLAGCRSGREAVRSSSAEDYRMEYRSIAFASGIQMDSVFSSFDFEADSITVTFADSAASRRQPKITIHNPRGHADHRQLSKAAVTATVADTVYESATVNTHHEAEKVSSTSGMKKGIIAGIIVGALLAGIICRWLMRRN